MKYVNNDGNVIYHEDKILQNWESAFKKLCTNPNGNFDDLFYNLAILHKTILKNNSMDPGFTPNDMLKINNPVFFLILFNLYMPARFINVLKQKKNYLYMEESLNLSNSKKGYNRFKNTFKLQRNQPIICRCEMILFCFK